ncbi:HlyD family efflux transporter periplasmic adaptor subunit [Cellulomonas sp. P5_C6]
MPDAATRPSVALRRRARRRRIVALTAAGAVVLVAAGGGVALALGGPDDSRYRTATAETGSVEQIVDSVGTIASVSRRDAAFSVDGTVATVNVSVGQVVAAGDVLATLDTGALQDAVDKAQADLADAQQQLSDDLDSQTASTSSSSSSSSASSSSASSSSASSSSSAKSSSTPSASASASASPSASPSAPATGADPHGGADSTDPAVAKAAADVQQAQQALLDQYKVTADALATSGASVTASQASCAAFLAVVGTDVTGDDPADASGDDSGDATPTPDPTSTDGTTSDPAPTADDATTDDSTTDPDPTAVERALADCQAALSGALDAQTATDTEQQALMTLADALDQAVQALQKAIASSSSTTTPTSSTPSTTAPTTSTSATTTPATTSTPTTSTPTTSTPSSSSSTPSGSTTTVATAATILADQAAIDLQEANVALAQSRLPFSNLTSPIAGTVAAVSLAAGDSVSASSTTAVITVLGPDGYTVTTSVPLTKIDIVTVGQTAQVTTPSTDTTLTGTVSSIGVLDTSTTADPAYTVELALDPTDATLYDGASAQVHLSVAGADGVLTVPTSAVHVDGATATVQVLKNGAPTDVTVTRGAVGAERTEITDGLSAGDEVVLADNDQAIVSSTSSTSSGLSGLGGDSTDQGPPAGFVFDGGGQGGPPAGFTGGGANPNG